MSITRQVLYAYRQQWRILLAASFVVFALLNAVELLVPDVEADHVTASKLAAAIALGGGSLAVSSFEEAFYEGVVASAANEWRSGDPRPNLSVVARSVPYLVLIALNLVIALVTGLGLLLLVVPGVVLSTYIGLSPAAAKIEHLGVRAALRRSCELVRGHLWQLMVLLWGFYLASQVATSALDEALHGIVFEYLAKTTAEALIAPFYALALVLATYELIDGPAARTRRPAGARGS